MCAMRWGMGPLIDAETGQITDRDDYDARGNVIHNGSTRQPFTGTPPMDMNGQLPSACTTWAHGNMTPAPPAGCNATR